MQGVVIVRKFIIKRILISVVILFFVAFIIYVLMRCLPTSYLEQIAREKSMQPGSKSYDEWMAQLSATYGMDKGIVPGFFAWCGRAIRGDFGDSWKWTVPVTEKFADSVWISFIMGAISFFFEIIISLDNLFIFSLLGFQLINAFFNNFFIVIFFHIHIINQFFLFFIKASILIKSITRLIHSVFIIATTVFVVT